MRNFRVVAVAALLAGCIGAGTGDDVGATVAKMVRPLMKQYGIPGMAVGLTIRGHRYVFNYGVASEATREPVNDATLFEIGSISKTLTATLTSYAALSGKLALSDIVSRDYPPLRGSAFDRVRLVNLGTHTAGGLPLQFPDAVRTDADAMQYYEHWKPLHPAGTYRLYSNPSIMLLGVVAAKRLGYDFATAMQRIVLAPLGLRNTFLTVPNGRLSHYAQGYTDAGKPRRMFPGPLSPEAYGIRTTASDLLRFIDANLNASGFPDRLHRAIAYTHAGYYRAGPMTQDLIWEQYHYPAALPDLLQGNAGTIAFGDTKVTRIDPPSALRNDVLINKTGSTSGFSAYAAFIPERKTGIVLLANKAYPLGARVTAAYRILERLP